VTNPATVNTPEHAPTAEAQQQLVSQESLDRHRRQRRLRENLTGYLFVSPAVLLISLFGIFPVFFTIFVSMHNWRIIRGRFVAMRNFEMVFGTLGWALIVIVAVLAIVFAARLINWARARTRSHALRSRPIHLALLVAGWLAVCAGAVAIILVLPQIWANGDDEMLDSLRVTIWFSLGTVPIQLAFGLILAVLLDQKFAGRQFFRVVFLLPYIVPTVASAAIFDVLFSLRPESFANQLVGIFGWGPLQWLGERTGILTMIFGTGAAEVTSTVAQYWQTWGQGPSLALVSIMFFNYWVYIGYYALIYSNGLANIPRQLYEAAEVDGAKRRTVLFRITVPLLSPTTFFLTLLGVIGTFKSFNSIYVLRDPGTGGATDTMSIHIFFTFFRRAQFGSAAAMALILFVLVLGLTFLQRRLMERRIHYGD
jgi:multiple sugar transport system permease protein